MGLQRNVELSDGDCRELFILLNKPFYMHGITQYRACIHQPANSQLSQNNLTGCCQLEILRIWSLAPLQPTRNREKNKQTPTTYFCHLFAVFLIRFSNQIKIFSFLWLCEGCIHWKIGCINKGKTRKNSLFYFILVTCNKKVTIHRQYS